MNSLPWRTLALAVAVLAELSSLALLAVSGWFLAACALAGLGVWATFAYPAPSGIVRMLALTRIGAGYGQSVLLHRVALADTTRQRLAVFDAVAASGSSRDDRQVGQLLTDAEREGQRVITVTAPVVVSVAVVVSALVVAAVIYPVAGAVLAAGSIAVAALGLVRPVVPYSDAEARAEILASVAASPELESLGGSALLRERVNAQLAELAASERAHDVAGARRRGILALTAGLTFGLTVVAAALTTPPALDAVPLFVMFVCLVFGVTERAFALGEAGAHRSLLRGSREAVLTERGEHLPAAPARVDSRGAVEIEAGAGIVVEPGQIAALRGPSGVGKTTLLRAIAASAASGTSVALVADDEFLFTGTVGGNVRLGAPEATDAQIDAACRAVGLADDIDARTPTGVAGRPLSRGESRRIMIVRAVFSRPDVLLIDEIDLGLDTATFGAVLEFVRSEVPSAAILVTTHSVPPHPLPTLTLSAGDTAAWVPRGAESIPQ